MQVDDLPKEAGDKGTPEPVSCMSFTSSSISQCPLKNGPAKRSSTVSIPFCLVPGMDLTSNAYFKANATVAAAVVKEDGLLKKTKLNLASPAFPDSQIIMDSKSIFCVSSLCLCSSLSF